MKKPCWSRLADSAVSGKMPFLHSYYHHRQCQDKKAESNPPERMSMTQLYKKPAYQQKFEYRYKHNDPGG